jgi:hypothetical protein
MNALHEISSRNYEGHSGYDKTKFIWARINVPANQHKPTYIIVRKNGRIIGGSVITHQNFYARKSNLKIRLGIIHETFLDKDIFTNSYNKSLGYIYLIDKVIKAATRRSLGVLLYESGLRDVDLNRAFKGMLFFRIQSAVIMIKELKPNLKFPKLKKPLIIPTALSLGTP